MARLVHTDHDHVVRVVMEWWRTSGPRSLDRLHSLAEHFGRVHAIEADHLYRLACAKVQDWERADMIRLPK